MTKSVALVAFGSTRTIVVIVAFGTQRSRPSIWSPVIISCCISSSSVLSLIWLLILVIPGSGTDFLLFVSLRSATLCLFVHVFSGGTQWIRIVLGIVAITLPWIVSGKPPTYFSTWSITSGNIRSGTLVPVLGNCPSWHCMSSFMSSGLNVGIPPCKSISLQGTRSKLDLACYCTVAYAVNRFYLFEPLKIIVVNLDSSSDNNNSDSYSTSQISTSEEIDYDSPEPPKSLLKWYHYLSDEYKDNGRFWGSKSGCNESDVKPSWKDIEKAKACMLAKAQASEASSKAKVEACGSKVKVEALAQGYNQQEGIDYDELYAPVARLESIRILLAIAYANDFKLYQMDVKSSFLNGFIIEEVYVAQPPRFIDFQKPNYVYKLKKALYGLKQAPKAWYDRLKTFLIKHEYSMGMVDNTLFIKKSKSHLIIVQIYVDDIIFGSMSQNLCDDFAKIMHDEFEMSMMGELNFFLGLQIKQIEDGIFFNQSKYIKEMLKKFGLEDSKPTKTLMSTEIKLTKVDDADFVDSSKYQGMIGSLLYLTASRPDIMFSVCL
ncbi:retrovirus-related pol polyprotein from transposon TNT 1-94 [Tanacetum coccineum]